MCEPHKGQRQRVSDSRLQQRSPVTLSRKSYRVLAKLRKPPESPMEFLNSDSHRKPCSWLVIQLKPPLESLCLFLHLRIQLQILKSCFKHLKSSDTFFLDTHTCSHTKTETHTHAYTPVWKHTYIHTCAHMCIYTHLNTYTQAHRPIADEETKNVGILYSIQTPWKQKVRTLNLFPLKPACALL